MNTRARTRTNSSTRWLTALAVTASALLAIPLSACGGDNAADDGSDQPGALTKDEARAAGKADGTEDYCEYFEWYGDGICDDFCLNPDPDCGAGTCEAAGGACVSLSPDECFHGTFADSQTYSCGGARGLGCCMPSSEPDPGGGFPLHSILTCDGDALTLDADADHSDRFIATIKDQGIIDYLVSESKKTVTEDGWTVTKDFPWYVKLVDGPEGRSLIIKDFHVTAQPDGYSTSDPAASLEWVDSGMKLTMRGMVVPGSTKTVRYEIGNWTFQSCALIR